MKWSNYFFWEKKKLFEYARIHKGGDLDENLRIRAFTFIKLWDCINRSRTHWSLTLSRKHQNPVNCCNGQGIGSNYSPTREPGNKVGVLLMHGLWLYSWFNMPVREILNYYLCATLRTSHPESEADRSSGRQIKIVRKKQVAPKSNRLLICGRMCMGIILHNNFT